MKNIIIASSLLFVSFTTSAETTNAAIASAHPLATEAGIEILKQGGNAFDAAITVSSVLAVVEPYSSGIGGGGFWLLHREKDKKQIMIDGREVAPGSAHKDMYLDKDGKVVPRLSLDGALAAGIPGEIAALVHLSENYGNLPLEKTLAPAIKIANDGFAVTKHYQKMTGFRLETLRSFPSSAEIFLKGNEVPELGALIIQKDLADTLRSVSKKGVNGFYRCAVAEKLVEGVQAAGGIWSIDDLKNYKVIERQPIISTYKGIKLVSAAPPSSGGIVLAQTLNILEHKNLDDFEGVEKKHLVVEAMRRAYADRAKFLGDPDFVEIPNSLVSKPYATLKAASIKRTVATKSDSLNKARDKGTDTTHFSILDSEGNRVSATLSINFPFGSGFVVPGTGVLLNDEMDDFSTQPGVPNGYGLVGGKANEIAPGKRPLSSMSPTFLETESQVAILGTPGGSRIISMVLLGILDFAEGNGPESWVSLPRYHHQYLPDQIQHESDAFNEQEKKSLESFGHELKEMGRQYGNMHAILRENKSGEIKAASDPRGEGQAEIIKMH